MNKLGKKRHDSSTSETSSSHSSSLRQLAFRLLCLVVFIFLAVVFTACNPKTTPTPTGPTGTLQVTVQGLPSEAAAELKVEGPEEYAKDLEKSQTLDNLRTGSYTLSADVVIYQDISYAVEIDGEDVTEITVDVVEDKTVNVTVSYTSAGEVAPDELAPGIPRTGEVTEDAFDDYTFQGVENVPLLFDFTGTSDATTGEYTVAIFSAADLDAPLFTSPLFSSGSFYPRPLIGFSPPETGDYVFRVWGEEDTVTYRVTARYLNGSPDEREEPTELEVGDTAEGAVTAGSYDSYSFTSSAAETIVLGFSYDLDDKRYKGSYHVELYEAGEGEALEVTRAYVNTGVVPEVELSLPAAGDYLIRVVGIGQSPSSAGTSLLRYQFVLKRGE